MWQLVGCSCEEKRETCGGLMTEGTQKGPREVDFVSCFSHAPHVVNPFSSVLAVHPWWLCHTSTSNHSRDPSPRLDISLCSTISLMFSEGFSSPMISLRLGPQPGWLLPRISYKTHSPSSLSLFRHHSLHEGHHNQSFRNQNPTLLVPYMSSVLTGESRSVHRPLAFFMQERL